MASYPARMKDRSGMVTEGRSRNRRLRSSDCSSSPFFLLLSGLLGGHTQQIAIFGPDKEQVREVPGALVVALLVDGDTQVFGLLRVDDGPIFMDTGDGQYLTVSVALDTHLDMELLELFQLSLYPQRSGVTRSLSFMAHHLM